jgi:hypothetical protein
MVFAFRRAKKKRSLKRRLALTKNGWKRYLEIASLEIGLLERRRFGGLFLCLNVSCLIERVRGSLFRAARGCCEELFGQDRRDQRNSAGAGLARMLTSKLRCCSLPVRATGCIETAQHQSAVAHDDLPASRREREGR